MKNKRKYIYEWQTIKDIDVLIDGDEYFSAMLEQIQLANKTILLEVYLFESGDVANKFINHLIEAKTRGVNVYLLMDDYGTQELNDFDKRKLTNAGIIISIYNPIKLFKLGRSLKRDHRKLLIIDHETAFIGGAGITDEFSPADSVTYWHDVMLKINGAVVDDFIHSFAKIWNRHSPSKINFIPDSYIKNNLNHNNDNKARVLLSEGTNHNEINRAIVARIRSSKKRVWLTSPYFISSLKIRRALRAAAKKGVDVRLIFPGKHSDHSWISHGVHRYYPRLLRANVSIYEYLPRFTHSKIIMCDDWFTIGTSNLDRWGQFLNLDVNIEIFHSTTCEKIHKLFQLNFTNSKLVLLEEWRTRSKLTYIKEWLAGLLIIFLNFVIRNFRR